MTLVVPGRNRHTDRILAVVGNGLGDDNNDVVARSWSRCLDEYRLHPDKPRSPAILERIALEARCASRADVIECARDICTYIYETHRRFPAHCEAIHVPGVWLQAHHVEEEYYDRFFRGGLTDAHRSHEQAWHPQE